jgi:hypothetical protein
LQCSFLNRADECQDFILPLICGFVGQVEVPDQQHIAEPVDIVLISRMHRKRVGTRYTRRGVDVCGHAAIMVETEMIAFCHGKIASFVQTRGSVPLLWQQQTNLQYKPPISIEDADGGLVVGVFRKHFKDMLSFYERVCIVNVLDAMGYEGPLCQSYTRLATNLIEERSNGGQKDLHYIGYSLNRPKQRVEDLLLETLDVIKQFGYFSVSLPTHLPRRDMSSKTVPVVHIKKTQHGVFRINCLDCLDRTNMVQFLFAQEVLSQLLHDIGIFHDDFVQKNTAVRSSAIQATRTVAQSSAQLLQILGHDGLSQFRNLWAANGDAISHQCKLKA